MYPNVSLDETGSHTGCCREPPFRALWRHRSESAGFPHQCFCVSHIDFQANSMGKRHLRQCLVGQKTNVMTSMSGDLSLMGGSWWATWSRLLTVDKMTTGMMASSSAVLVVRRQVWGPLPNDVVRSVPYAHDFEQGAVPVGVFLGSRRPRSDARCGCEIVGRASFPVVADACWLCSGTMRSRNLVTAGHFCVRREIYASRKTYGRNPTICWVRSDLKSTTESLLRLGSHLI